MPSRWFSTLPTCQPWLCWWHRIQCHHQTEPVIASSAPCTVTSHFSQSIFVFHSDHVDTCCYMWPVWVISYSGVWPYYTNSCSYSLWLYTWVTRYWKKAMRWKCCGNVMSSPQLTLFYFLSVWEMKRRGPQLLLYQAPRKWVMDLGQWIMFWSHKKALKFAVWVAILVSLSLISLVRLFSS